MERGELRPDIDTTAVLDALYAPLYLRLMVEHAPIDDAFIDELVAIVFDGIAAGEG